MVRTVPRVRSRLRSLGAVTPDVLHAKVDSEAEQQIAAALEIQAIPTIMAFRDGILVYRQAGAMPAAALEDLITRVKALDMAEVRAKVGAENAASR